MVIKINYTSSDVYVSTSVSPVYVVVNYSGTSGGGGNFVPYTGATADVDLGEFELSAGQLTLDTTPTGTASVGTTRWNDTIGSSETTLKGGNVILKNGVDLVARVVNKVTPNATLTKAAYQAVKISGAQGQRLAVALAQANNDANSADTIGLVTETIATNQEGFIMTVGNLEGINTTGSLQGETWVDGDVLYLSPTTAGALTNIKPTGATGHIVVVGYVEYAHANNGKIYCKIMNGWELDELHNVYITSPANNDALIYESATSLWKNKTIATALGYTPLSGSGVTGQVAYWNGTNSQTGSNNLFWDAANSRLGIGTNAPAYKLDVNGNQRVNGSINISNANGLLINNILNATSNGDQQTGLGVNVSFVDGAFTGVNHYALQIAGSGYSQLTANVGAFNLPTNGFGLQVGWNKSNGGGETSLWFNKSAGSTGGLFIGENVSGTGTYFAKFFATTGNLVLQNGGTFTDAGYRLDVNGTARVSGVGGTSSTLASSSFTIIDSNTNLGTMLTFGYGTGYTTIRRGSNPIDIHVRDSSFAILNIPFSIGATNYTVTQNTTKIIRSLEDNYILQINANSNAYSNDGIYINDLTPSASTFSGITWYSNIVSKLTGRIKLNIGSGGNSPNMIFEIASSGTLNEAMRLFSTTNIGINSATDISSAQLHITSTTKGFLPPRMTTAERDAIATPATGLQIYNTTTNENNTYNGTAWVAAGGGSTSPAGSNTQIQYNNSGAFGASAGLTYNDSTGVMTLSKNLNIGTINQSTTYGLSNYLFIGYGHISSSNDTSPDFGLSQNVYYNGTNNIYTRSGFSNTFYLSQFGHFQFYTTASGIAGATATLNEKMRLTNAGRLLLGTTTESTYLLDVNGTARFIDSINVVNVYFGRGLNGLTQNLFIGELTGTNNTTGQNNTIVGAYSGNKITTGFQNTTLGSLSGRDITTSSRNTLVGCYAGFKINTGINNTCIGSEAGSAITDGQNNACFGVYTGLSITGGNTNTLIGYEAGRSITTGGNNTFVGGTSGGLMATGDFNVGIGYYAGRNIADGTTANAISNNSIFIGTYTKALANNQTNQIVIGYDATGLGSNTTIIGNSSTITTALRGRLLLGTTTDTGSYQLDVNGTARVSGDVLINGVRAGKGNGSIGDNTCFGELSMGSVSGQANTAFGYYALQAITTGNYNTAVGVALYSGSTISSNTAVGRNALAYLSSGNNNVAIGNDSGSNLNTSSNSIFIGSSALSLADSQTNQIVIGHNATGAGSNTATLGNTSITKTILRGTLNAANLPTSSAGLSAGDIWNDGGTLKIV